MLLRGVEAINSPCPLFVSRNEDNINIIEIQNGDNYLKLTREEADKLLRLKTEDFIKFSGGAVQFWQPENEEQEVMIYFYNDENETSIIIAPYDEFETALKEILR